MDYDIHILRLAQQGYCCSQIVLHMALATEGTDNPGLIRAMAGLCNAPPKAQGACGAFTGACCLLGYYAGKGQDDDEDTCLDLMIDELSGWFEDHCHKHHSGSSCIHIIGDHEPQPQICGGLISLCYTKCIELLEDHGLSFGVARDE